MFTKDALQQSNIYNKFLYFFYRKSFERNLQFKNLHKDESCYIFGNGESIKSMDLKNFSDKVSIGCNNLFFHKDFEELDCRYYQIVPPFIFLPYFPFYGKFTRNYYSSLYRKSIKKFYKTNFITSIYNKNNLFSKNVYYEHHFGSKIADLENCKLDKSFSFMEGATNAMIGTAIYMGFKKAILVGLDYTFKDSRSHHFFERGLGKSLNPSNYNRLLFEKLNNKIEIMTITLEGKKSDFLNYKTYLEFTGEEEIYRENTEIVNKEILDDLQKFGFYNIY